MQHQPNRKGFSLVELQISFLVFAIGVAGLGPLVVMQSRQFDKIESRLNAQTMYYVAPSRDEWARKLGASASLLTSDPGPAAAAPDLVIDDGESGFNIENSVPSSGGNPGKGKGKGKKSNITWELEASAGSFQGTSHFHDGEGGADIARWEFTGLAPGWYDVRVTWLEDDLLTKEAPFAVYEGAALEGEFTLNQQVAPSGDVIEGRPWESLGIFPITGDTLIVEVKDVVGGRVAADAVRLIPVKNDVRIDSLDKSMSSEEVTAHVTVTVQVPQ